MARTFEEIQNEIKVKIRENTELDSLLFPEDGGSKVSAFNLTISTMAIVLLLFESILDVIKSDIQKIADSAPSGNASWIRAQIKKFQFGDIIELVDFVPTYPIVDESKQIVTQVAVRRGNTIEIKVAKGISPNIEPLTSAELLALQDYWYGTSLTEGVGFAGEQATFLSQEPDRVRIEAMVYYRGQFVEDDLKSTIIDAINSFLTSFSDDSFGGVIFFERAKDAIQAVNGVTRVVVVDVKARAFSVPVSGANEFDPQGFYISDAGYAISEDSSGETLNETITLIEDDVI